MIAEQYGAELHYIPGSKNIVADALSRLGLEPSTKSEPNETVKESPQMRLLAQSFAFTPVEVQPPSPTFQKQGRLAQIFATTRSTVQEIELPTTVFPLSFRILTQEQQKDQTLKKKVTDKVKNYSIRSFHGGEKNCLLILKDER